MKKSGEITIKTCPNFTTLVCSRMLYQIWKSNDQDERMILTLKGFVTAM